jgi:ankyrin
LHYASTYGHASVASILVQNGANVETRAACTMGSLHLAAHYDQMEVVRVLLDNGADISSKTNDDKTALHTAVKQNSLRVVQLLLSRNTNFRGMQGESGGCYKAFVASPSQSRC